MDDGSSSEMVEGAEIPDVTPGAAFDALTSDLYEDLERVSQSFTPRHTHEASSDDGEDAWGAFPTKTELLNLPARAVRGGSKSMGHVREMFGEVCSFNRHDNHGPNLLQGKPRNTLPPMTLSPRLPGNSPYATN